MVIISNSNAILIDNVAIPKDSATITKLSNGVRLSVIGGSSLDIIASSSTVDGVVLSVNALYNYFIEHGFRTGGGKVQMVQTLLGTTTNGTFAIPSDCNELMCVCTNGLGVATFKRIGVEQKSNFFLGYSDGGVVSNASMFGVNAIFTATTFQHLRGSSPNVTVSFYKIEYLVV